LINLPVRSQRSFRSMLLFLILQEKTTCTPAPTFFSCNWEGTTGGDNHERRNGRKRGSNSIPGSGYFSETEPKSNPFLSTLEPTSVPVPNIQDIIVKFRQYCIVDERLARSVAKDYKNTVARFFSPYGEEISREAWCIKLEINTPLVLGV